MLLRPATMEDADLLFLWRNDPETRKNSHTTEEVPYDNHVAWLRSSLTNSRRRLLIAIADVPIGTVRYDWQDQQNQAVELSWTIAPEHRGKGFGTIMVAEAVKDYHGNIMAEIKSSNAPSIAIARKNGFIPLSENGEVMRWIRYASKLNTELGM